ncbi:Pls/PosA family non-ribosomal peptide synthetase [Streptomyces sp. GC420]|uniref:Pls/PosA family non-ribosomal peptide synthetase n=1 Tax=Streptomyces sp. GC420 TaxID=2697568 RepID=UPI0028BEC616|nr:Pls/PosA family non-ribosomal peptide synthetase [Streptomyces sp. GC420]
MAGKSSEVSTAVPPEPAATASGRTDAAAGTETTLAELLADVVRVDRVPVDSHFFDDLGANSLLMAHFCARVRKRADLPSVSMRDIYRHPTIRSLAQALADSPPPPAPEPVRTPEQTPSAHGTRRYVLCGTAQLLFFCGYCLFTGIVLARGYSWVSGGKGVAGVYLRSAVFGGAVFAGACALPVAAKWMLVGRWKPGEFPVWGPAYLRLWTVRVLLHANPMVLLVGNPLYVLYLRALGARIGRGVTILTRTVPVCTDLLTVGAGTVIRKDCALLCYRAHAGRIQTGPVVLGRDVLVGERTVIDIDTVMGDGAQLGHASALHRGVSVPAGQRWHGSPAQRTDVSLPGIAPADCGTARRAAYGLVTLLQLFLVYLPLSVGGSYMLFAWLPDMPTLFDPAVHGVTSGWFYGKALVLSFVLFFGLLTAGLAAVTVLPRLTNLLVRPGRVYPLYGFHYSVHRAVAVASNIKLFTWLFGDSSYIVHYLRAIGYDLSHVEQTGSNFGTELKHESPVLTSVGRGTMVADGLSVLNAEYSSTSFRLARVSIGPHNFLGNNIAYPAGGRTGDDCLLATKVMVPLDGHVREGVGLLGSPPFEIPRSVERDTRFDHLRTGDEQRRRLAAKNRYNLRSMGQFLVLRWLHSFGLLVIGAAAVTAYDPGSAAGQLLIAASVASGVVFTALYFVLVERAVLRFGGLRPQLCSIYDPYFWWHERLWKVPDRHLIVFNGTPFKNVVWRLMGVRIGRRVFDDGCFITERTLTAIGSDATLNAGSKIQCHSQEDGTFKSDHVTIGAGCTLGVGAFVHYGVTLGDGAELAADSFLMKGEDVPPGARWGGNPAVERTGASHCAHPAP